MKTIDADLKIYEFIYFSSIALINELAGSHKFAGHVAMIAVFVRT